MKQKYLNRDVRMIFPGWLFKLELTKLHELAGLMSEADYEKFLKTDAH